MGKGGGGGFKGGAEFGVGGLRDTRDEVICGRVEEGDPVRGSRRDKAVVEEVLGVGGLGDGIVSGWVGLRRTCCSRSGCRCCWREVGCEGMEAAGWRLGFGSCHLLTMRFR